MLYLSFLFRTARHNRLSLKHSPDRRLILLPLKVLATLLHIAADFIAGILQLAHVVEGFQLVTVLMVMVSASVLKSSVGLVVTSVMRDFMDFLTANVSLPQNSYLFD